jgi:hypothetical protein
MQLIAARLPLELRQKASEVTRRAVVAILASEIRALRGGGGVVVEGRAMAAHLMKHAARRGVNWKCLDLFEPFGWFRK